jgi:16S rRNA (cytosine967-C5)-methyltransferase
MDRVVIDAPCTGSGTWRRRPDTKWKLTGQQLEQRMAEQDAVLAQGATFVRPGGALVYITCSILDGENDARLNDFLSAHPDFTLTEGAPLWEQQLGPGAPAPWFTPGGAVALTPHRSGTDGFYVAVMLRAA